MSTGPFTQCACVLLEGPVPRAAIERALARFELVPLGADEGDGAALAVSMRPEADGLVIVDLVASPYPDDAEAAASGVHGPYAHEGALARAAQHAWVWPEAQERVARHGAYFRLRAARPETTAAPETRGRDAVLELLLVTELASALLELPGALALFVPGGETLRSAALVRDSLADCGQKDLPPLDLWSNVRLYELGGTDWIVMDTVGMGQLGVGDHEACFASEQYDYEAVDGFLRDTTYSELVSRRRIKDGDAIDGPGEVRGSRALAQVLPRTVGSHDVHVSSTPWQGALSEDSLAPPRRSVLRWVPLDGRHAPARLSKRQ